MLRQAVGDREELPDDWEGEVLRKEKSPFINCLDRDTELEICLGVLWRREEDGWMEDSL